MVKRCLGISNYHNFYSEIDLNKPVREIVFTVFDTETTGLNPKKDHLVSIGAIKIKNLEIHAKDCFHKLIKSVVKITPQSVEIHGVRPADIKMYGENEEIVLESFLNYIRGTMLIGFYVDFDFRMVSKYTKRIFGCPLLNYRVDVLDMYIKDSGIIKNMDEIASEFDLPVYGRHSAIDDAYITALIFLKLLSQRNYRRGKDLPIKII